MKKDILNRTQIVNSIKAFILKLSEDRKGYCFAINGKWGSGKSFVLDLLEIELREYQSEETCDNQFFLVHYNCWQYDYYSEPSIAIASALLDSVEEEKSFLGKETDGKINAAYTLIKQEVKSIAGKFLENQIGVNPIGIYDKIMEENGDVEAKRQKFDTLFSFKTTVDEVRKSLNKIAKEKTIVVVVDELDRCIPEYAVKVLERLHHLFEGIENIIVIVAVDKTQLHHSIKTIYGDKTEVDEYLKKIINLTFELDMGEMSNGIIEKYSSYFNLFSGISEETVEELERLFSVIWKGVDIRTQEKLMDKVNSIHKLFTEEVYDVSVALFEIMYVRYANVYGRSVAWIPDINEMRYGGLEEKIGKDAYEYIKRIQSTCEFNKTSIIGNIGETIRIDLTDDSFGKMFYLFTQVCKTRARYTLNSEEDFSSEIVVARKFVEFMNIIN